MVQSAPTGLTAPGTIIASTSSVLTDMPSPITSSTYGFFFVFQQQFDASQPAPLQTNGESFTCSYYDDATLIGTASATTQVVTSSSPSYTQSVCYATFASTVSSASNYAYIRLANGTYTPGDTLTLIMSH